MTPDGRTPLTGALVAIPSQGRSTISRTDGRFVLQSVPRGVSAIAVSAAGYQTTSGIITLSGDMALDFELRPPHTHALSGVVSEAGPAGQVPLHGVPVEESNTHRWTPDAESFYRINDLPPGEPDLRSSRRPMSGIRADCISGRRDVTLVRQ